MRQSTPSPSSPAGRENENRLAAGAPPFDHGQPSSSCIDDPVPGKHVKVRGTKRNGDGEIMHGHYVGVVREVKRDGACLVLDSGWHMNLDHGDVLIWCADRPPPDSVR